MEYINSNGMALGSKSVEGRKVSAIQCGNYSAHIIEFCTQFEVRGKEGGRRRCENPKI